MNRERQRLNELEIQSEQGRAARRNRRKEITDETFAIKDRIETLKNQLLQEEKLARQQQDRALISGFKSATPANVAGLGTADKLEELKRAYRDLGREAQRLNNLDLQSAQYKNVRKQRKEIIQAERFALQDLIATTEKQLAAEKKLAAERAKQAKQVSLLRQAKNLNRDAENRSGLTLTGGSTKDRVQQARAYIEKEILVRRQLIAAERALLRLKDQIDPKYKQAVANALQLNRALQQQANLNIKNTKSAVASANAQQTAMQNMTKGGHALFLNLSNAARVMQFILLHRAFFSLAQGIQQGAKAAAELSIRIGEIRTISDRNVTSHEQWKRTIRSLAAEFDQTLGSVAEGIYQAISNQVIQTNTQTTYFIENMKLATVAVSTFDNAIQATTSVINAFDMSVNETSKISGILFKTIELGRVRLDEMANTLGRVSVLASTLGISFEEQQASLAALTIQGVKHNTAETYLVNVMQKLIRPSDRMIEIFRSWGVESGESAIRTFGFGQVVEKLTQIAEESGDAMAEFGEQMQRVRATTGLVGLSGEKVNTIVGKMKNSAEALSGAYETVRETMGKRLQIELQKVANIFTLDFGEELTKTLIWLSDYFGGLNLAMLRMIQIMAGGVSAWLSYRVALNATIAAATAWNGAVAIMTRVTQGAQAATNGLTAATLTLRMALGSLIGVGVGLAIGALTNYFLKAKLAKIATEEIAREFAAKATTIASASQAYRVLSKTLDAYNVAAEASTRAARQTIATFAAATKARLDLFKPVFEELERTTDAMLTKTSDLASDVIKGLEKDIEGISKSIEDSFKNIRDSAFSRADSIFSATIRRLGFWGNEGLSVIENRIKFLQGRMQEIGRLAFGMGDPKAVKEAMQTIRSMQAEVLGLQQTLEKSDEIRKKSLEDQIGFADAAAKKYLDEGIRRLATATSPEEKEQAERLIKSGEDFLKRRNDLTDEYINKYETDLKAAGDKVLEMQREELLIIEQKAIAEQRYIDLINMEKAKLEADKTAKEGSFYELKLALDRIKDFDYVKGSPDDFKRLVGEADALAVASGVDIKGRLDLNMKLMTDYYTQLEQAQLRHDEEMTKMTMASFTEMDHIRTVYNQKLQDEEAKANEARNASIESLSEYASKIIQPTRESGQTMARVATATAERYKRELEMLKTMSADDPFLQTPLGKKLKQVEAQVKHARIFYEAYDAYSKIREGAVQSPEEVDKAKRTLEEYQKMMSERGLLDPAGLASAQQEFIKAQRAHAEAHAAYIQTLHFFNTTIKPQYEELYRIQNGIVDITHKSYEEQRLIIQNLQREIDLLKERAGLTRDYMNQNAIENNALGGLRGNDRRLVAMDPREFIVNAEASRTYRPILNAINSNRIPHFANGGPVTNVGDIRVSVNGGDTSAQTIHDIAQGINREIRLGRIKLNV